ncbi:MAG: hypothetical protein ABTD50_22715, partial [Polyangiaceae bacterium]
CDQYTCQAGECVGTPAVTCKASDACHAAGTCNPSTGACSNPAQPNGYDCGTNEVCNSGTCVSCQSGGSCNNTCQTGGTLSCASGTQQCINTTPSPDGTSCLYGGGERGSCVGGKACLANLGQACVTSADCVTGACSPQGICMGDAEVAGEVSCGWLSCPTSEGCTNTCTEENMCVQCGGGGTGNTFYCDGPNDCNAGSVCCMEGSCGGPSSQCYPGTTCPVSNAPCIAYYQVCSPDNTACPSGTTCQLTSDTLPFICQ